MESITKCLAANIKELRKRGNLTQSQLAEKAGISLIFLQGIEAERKWVSPATTNAIAKALDVSESKLFENCFEKKILASMEKSKGPKKRSLSKLDHLPDDIYAALETTCRHPNWKWEIFRWILDGYHRTHMTRA
jgi:transcriptional regulator with XRE-family HTH domain